MYTCKTGHYGKETMTLCLCYLNCLVFIFCIELFRVIYIYCCIFLVIYFHFILFHVVLKAFQSLLQILLILIWQIFGQTLRVFYWVWEIRLIYFLVIFVLISKLSECKQVELFAALISDFIFKPP